MARDRLTDRLTDEETKVLMACLMGQVRMEREIEKPNWWRYAIGDRDVHKIVTRLIKSGILMPIIDSHFAEYEAFVPGNNYHDYVFD